MNTLSCLVVTALCFPWGHPLSERMFERTVEVVAHESHVEIRYELGLTELTMATELLAFSEPGEVPINAAAAMRFYQQRVAPVLARGLIVTVAGKELVITPHDFEPPKVEEHITMVFRFRGLMPAIDSTPVEFSLFESNFAGERGYRRLVFHADPALEIVQSNVPTRLEEALDIPSWEMTPEQELACTQVIARIRSAAKVAVSPKSPTTLASPLDLINAETPPSTDESTVAGGSSEHDLRELLEQSDKGWLWPALLATAFGFGMIHAVKPGHGKTLVAAYLVGQHGTIYHASLLGLITAATHTGSVMFVALMLRPFAGTRWVEQGTLSFWLTLLSGLLVMSLGATLLWRRLRGKEDLFHVHGEGGHVHLPDGSIQWTNGGEHVHSHGHNHHHDHDHGHHHAHTHHHLSGEGKVRWTSLLTLGFSGGLVPCDDAVVLLLAAIGAGLLTQAVYILLAFSLGLAAVLVLIGILVVKMKGFAAKSPSTGPWLGRLQIASAAAITVIGAGICLRAWV